MNKRQLNSFLKDYLIIFINSDFTRKIKTRQYEKNNSVKPRNRIKKAEKTKNVNKTKQERATNDKTRHQAKKTRIKMSEWPRCCPKGQ